MADFAVAVQEHPGAAVLKLQGKGDRAAIERLQEQIDPLVARGVRALVFDCAGVEFFNSTALGYFINLADAVGTVAFCRVPKRVQMAFDLLSLGECFRFYSDETEALATRPPPAPGVAEIRLPDWLEEADATALPLDHPRWHAFLRTAGVPPGSIREMLRKFRSPQELLGTWGPDKLANVAALFGIPAEVDEIVAFVQRSTTESLSGATEEATVVPDLTADNLARALEACRIPKPAGDAAARNLVFDWLSRVFGQVAKSKGVGTTLKTKADLEVAGTFGVLVRRVKKTSLPALLGQAVMLAGIYGRGNAFLVLVGEAPAELKAWLEPAGVRVVTS